MSQLVKIFRNFNHFLKNIDVNYDTFVKTKWHTHYSQRCCKPRTIHILNYTYSIPWQQHNYSSVPLFNSTSILSYQNMQDHSLQKKFFFHRYNYQIQKHGFRMGFHSLSIQECNKILASNNSSIFRSYSSKRGNVSNVHSPIASIKTKKRAQRKKRNVDEHSEVDAEGFLVSEHHRFLTFDPDFAIPDISLPKHPPKEFQTVAYATADEYNLEELSNTFEKQGLYMESSIIRPSANEDSSPSLANSKMPEPEDVLHLSAAYQVTREPRSMFIFRDGVIVFWNVPSLERLNILKFLKSHEMGSYAEDIVQEEVETLVYTYTDSATRLKSSQNLILLNEQGETNLEKYAFSNALAMSVKLGIWEASLDRYIENIEHVTEELRKSGVVILSQEQVLQRMGELFALRHLTNLSSDLLDTPDFYWEHESVEPLYTKTANHLSTHKRTSVMNTKLSHCLELMELMKSHLNDRHASRLEWIIIILIMVEVFFEILHFV